MNLPTLKQIKEFIPPNLLTRSSQSLEKEDVGAFVIATIVVTILIGLFHLAVIGIAKEWFPWTIPYHLMDMWKTVGAPSDWITAAWPIFAWAIGFNVFVSITTRNKGEHNRNAESLLAAGTIISLWAGITEEIIFRWLIFLSAFPLIAWGNHWFFGFAGFGIAQWVQINIAGPLADWTTLGLLHHYLGDPKHWMVGAAIISANAAFRDGHKYQGWFGWINSWFIGMWFFYLALTFGLPASILCHFLYDLFIFAVRYIDCAAERALGWTDDEPTIKP